MTYKEIQELIKLLNKSELAEFKLKDGDFELSIRTKIYVKNQRVESVVPAPSALAPVFLPSESNTAPANPSTAPKNVEQSDNNADDTSNLIEVKSPMVGTFYRSPDPEKAAFVKPGDNIAPGDAICIIEAMKLFNEIEAEVSGKIVKVMVENASPVEYDQVLFLVDPNA